MITIPANGRGKTIIGRLGENEHRRIVFRESAPALAMYPNASVTVLHQRPGDPTAYPVSSQYVQIVDGMVCWTVQSGDLTKEGNGQCEVILTQDGTVAKLLIYTTEIQTALDGAGTPPDPWKSYVQQVEEAAEAAEAAVEHYPQIIDGYWYVWDVESGGFVNTGVPADGSSGANALKSEGYAVGTQNGTPVEPGSSFFENNAKYWSQKASEGVTHYPKIQSGTWWVWDVQNETWTDTGVAAQGPAGQDGQDGQDGRDGTDGVGVPPGGTTGKVLAKKTNTDYDTEWVDQPSVPVTDVQVNGTSILNNGIANVPVAAQFSLGVTKGYGNAGINIDASGNVSLDVATSSKIKSAISTGSALSPGRQHESTFYGLAKAAGDSTQSASSNAVGNYTDSAKAAIKTMLGVPVWKSITLSENDYDNTVGAFVFDAGNGNEIAEARVYGQIVWDEEQTNIKIGCGFGNNSGYDSYNKFSIKTGITSSKRIAISAEGKNIAYSNSSISNNIIRSQFGYGYYGNSNNNTHAVNVDAGCTLEMQSKGTCAYWNFNDPRYFSIYAPAGAAWAFLYIEYVLR